MFFTSMSKVHSCAECRWGDKDETNSAIGYFSYKIRLRLCSDSIFYLTTPLLLIFFLLHLFRSLYLFVKHRNRSTLSSVVFIVFLFYFNSIFITLFSHLLFFNITLFKLKIQKNKIKIEKQF